MAANDNGHSRLSHAGQEPELRQTTPASLRRRAPLRPEFEQNRDPYVRAQYEAQQKTEKERREDSGRGSAMVRLNRPFPELRPKQAYGPLKASFNQAWLKEQRAARLATLKTQRACKEERMEPAHDRALQAPLRER